MRSEVLLKSRAWQIVILICFIVIIPKLSMATIIEVCPGCEIKSITEAIDIAEEGSTIIVKKGVYKETGIVIQKTLTLKAEPGAVIDGESKGEIIRIEADGVTIDGFEIINVGTSHLQDYAAVRVKESENFIVENLTIKKPFFAIYIEKSRNGIVRNNVVHGQAESEFNSGNGIQLWYSHNNLLEGNESTNMRDGIYFEFSNHNIISKNLSKDNIRYGLHFMFCNNNTVKENEYVNNGAGIAIMFSKEMDAHHNVFSDNWGTTAYGMLLKEVYDARLSHNTFRQNTTGINVEGCNRIIYEHNDFISNGWAINFKGANYHNTLTKNNFLHNSFDIAYNGHVNSNSFDGNYWSDYRGYDLNRDGIGDVPYNPVKLFSYLVNKSPEAIVLLRSMFIDIVDFAEKVSPVFTPENLNDTKPSMKKIEHD